MSQMPDIKPEVNKEPGRDKKAAGGLLARLFGGGGGAGGIGAGGLGGGGLGGAAASGGLLATKAGLLALIVAGTTVAGGVGVVGYRLFGPSADNSGAGNLSLFAPRPKSASGASSAAPAPADGTSKSLNMLAQGNASLAAVPAGGAGAAALTDRTAADAARVAENASSGQINASNGAERTMPKGLLHVRKIGTLTSGVGEGGGGGGGATASVAPSNGFSPGGAAAENGTRGSLSAMNRHGRASLAHGRGIAARRFNGARAQAFGALGDQHGALSSFSAGRTYDGSAPIDAGITGPQAGAPGMGGPGAATGAAQPTSLPNGANDKTDIKAPPTPPMKNVTPWQNAINTAQGLMMAATLIMMLMGKVTIPWARYALGAIVMAMGAAIVALGQKITSGPYGQKLQGGVLAAAGIGIIAAAVLSMMSASDNTHAAKDGKVIMGTTTNGQFAASSTGTEMAPASYTGGGANGTAVGGESADMFGMNPYVLLGGGAALVGLAGTMLKPPKSYPSTQFNNGKPPDANWFGYREFPSQTALKTMVALKKTAVDPAA